MSNLGLAAVIAFTIAGCANQNSNTNTTNAIAEVSARQNNFTTYPQPNTTYLSFSQAHGFQVNYLAPQGRAWLWYPGNQRGVAEEYKLDVIAGQNAICWRHPSDSYNPVTRTKGGAFACQNQDFAQKTIVAALSGDPFSLKTGQVPHTLERCVAPSQFNFDRRKTSC